MTPASSEPTPAPLWRRAAITAALALLGVLCMWLVGQTIDPRRVVAGDAHYVFAAARSLAFDGDLDLTNQYRVMGDRWGLGRDPTHDGWRLPPREIGPSLVMIPGLWLHHLARLPAALEPSYACLLSAASIGPCWLACAKLLDRVLPEQPRRAMNAEALAGAAVLGFVVPYYSIGAPGYAHALDATITAWLTLALVQRRSAVAVGVLLACAVLVRLQNSLWLLWPLAEVVGARGQLRPLDRRGPLARALLIAAIASFGLAPQLWLGLAHPGSARGSLGWTLAFFDVDDYGRDLVRVLFGVHGLIRWTPIAGLGLLGLGLGLRERDVLDARASRGAAIVCVGLWLLLASVADVDGGSAYGARRLAGITGVLALGLGWLHRALARRPARVGVAIVALILVLANVARTHQAIVGALSLTSADVGRR